MRTANDRNSSPDRRRRASSAAGRIEPTHGHRPAGAFQPNPVSCGNIGDLSEKFDLLTNDTAHSGIGTATTIQMTDEERANVIARNPIGFIWQ